MSILVEGNSGNDELQGTSGNDTLFGYDGNDTLLGGDGNDSLNGGTGHDHLDAGSGQANLYGGWGHDYLVALDASGLTGINAAQGNDTLVGSVPSDGQIHMRGGDGNDMLIMDVTNQTGTTGHHVYGGEGYDTFAIINTDAVQAPILGRIDDYAPNFDSLEIDGQLVDLSDSSTFPTGVSVVWYLGQQWLRINDNILYALDGARLGGSEVHFSPWPEDINALPEIQYIDPRNYLTPSDTGGAFNEIDSTQLSTTRLNDAEGQIDHDVSAAIRTFNGTEGNDYIDDRTLSPNDHDHDHDAEMHSMGHEMTVPLADQIFNLGGGDDVLAAGKGSDTVDAGSGNDIVYGGLDADVLKGGVGWDTMFGGSEDDLVMGEEGADHIYGNHGSDSLYGGAGVDKLWGGLGDDEISGGTEADQIYGEEGNDLIYMGSNFGFVYDFAFGDSGNDTIFGEAGFDHLSGGDGDDLIDGGNQADNLYGDAGNDTLIGDLGFDRLFGGDGNDSLLAGAGADALFGQTGNDSLAGGADNDRLWGGVGNDSLTGGADEDVLIGNAGFDTLIGGGGDDKLSGQFNADTFVFYDAHGHDTITDFEVDNPFEKIDLSTLSDIPSLDDLNLSSNTSGAAIQSGHDVIIATSKEDTITLLNISLWDLDQTDFIF